MLVNSDLSTWIDNTQDWSEPVNMNNDVKNPSHYNQGSVECIEAIEASMTGVAYLGYLKGNVMKYMWRYEKKIDPKQDLEKARWYLNRMIETLESVE